MTVDPSCGRANSIDWRDAEVREPRQCPVVQLFPVWWSLSEAACKRVKNFDPRPIVCHILDSIANFRRGIPGAAEQVCAYQKRVARGRKELANGHLPAKRCFVVVVAGVLGIRGSSYLSQLSNAWVPACSSSRLAKWRALARLWAVDASMRRSRESAVSIVEVATCSRGMSRSRASALT